MSSGVDKNQAVIDFLITCPAIRDNPLFFNYITAKDNNKQIVTLGNDKGVQRTYIDGSVLKQYNFTLMNYTAVSPNAVVKVAGYPSENVEDEFDIQGIVDWIEEQAEARNFPDFGPNCLIDEMYTTSSNPVLNGIDATVTPALAKYSITIRIEYLDTSKMLGR